MDKGHGAAPSVEAFHAMKVFRMNDYEWWAGKDLESVKAACKKETGLTDDEAFDSPRVLTAEEMRTHEFYPDCDVSRAIQFKTALRKMVRDGKSFPRFFATTEY